MKAFLLPTLLLAAATAWCAKPEVIPELRQWTDNAAAGDYTLGADARVVIPEDASPALVRHAQTFADEIGRAVARTARPGDIVLTVAPDPKANPEGYTLTAGKDGIRIAAPTPLGAFWGTRPAARPRTGPNTPTAASCSTAAASPSPSTPSASWCESAPTTS